MGSIPLSQIDETLAVAADTIAAAQEANVAFNLSVEHVQSGYKLVPSVYGDNYVAASRADDLGAVKHGETGGKATFTKSRYKVKLSLSDFVIDVHKIAKRVLTPGEWEWFERTYFQDYLRIAEYVNVHSGTDLDPKWSLVSADLTPEGRDKYLAEYLTKRYHEDEELIGQARDYDNEIRLKLGEAFIEHGLYPYKEYMNRAGWDVRVPINMRTKENSFYATATETLADRQRGRVVLYTDLAKSKSTMWPQD